MNYRPELLPKVLDKSKTQTRRTRHAGERFTVDPDAEYIDAVFHANGRTRFYVGQTHAVAPGRGLLGIYTCRDVVDPDGLSPAITYQLYSHKDIYPGDYGEDNQTWAYRASQLANPGKWLEGEGFVPVRLKILRIRAEDVRYISHEDVLAEGFKAHEEFFNVWCTIHDPVALKMHTEISKETVFQIADRLPEAARSSYLLDWSKALNERPDEHYQAWALTFELVEG